MTRLPTPSLTLRPESARPALIDGPRPDGHDNFDAQFVVEWQVVEPSEPADPAAPGPAA